MTQNLKNGFSSKDFQIQQTINGNGPIVYDMDKGGVVLVTLSDNTDISFVSVDKQSHGRILVQNDPAVGYNVTFPDADMVFGAVDATPGSYSLCHVHEIDGNIAVSIDVDFIPPAPLTASEGATIAGNDVQLEIDNLSVTYTTADPTDYLAITKGPNQDGKITIEDLRGSWEVVTLPVTTKGQTAFTLPFTADPARTNEADVIVNMASARDGEHYVIAGNTLTWVGGFDLRETNEIQVGYYRL